MADIYDVPSEGRREKIAAMAERFEMTDVMGDKILSYSHGMRQKMMVMGALILIPPSGSWMSPLRAWIPRRPLSSRK